LPEQRNVPCMVFSPDGRRVLCGGLDGRIVLWDVERGVEIAAFSGHEGPVPSVALSPDGRYALSGGWDHTVRLWRLPGHGDFAKTFARALHRLEHRAVVYDAAFSPDGRRVLSCGFDLALRLWDVQTGENLREFVGNKAWHIVNDLAFSPDGRYALLGAGQYYKTGRVTLWDVNDWTEVRQLGEHEYPVRCVAFSPDGHRAVSGSSEGYVRYLDVRTGREIRCYEPAAFNRVDPVRIHSLSFSPDGQLVVCAESGDTRIWEIETGRQVCLLKGSAANGYSALFVPDDNARVFTADGSMLRLWNVTTAREVRHVTLPDQVMALALSPDGRRSLAGHRSGAVHLWDLQTGRRLQTFEGHDKPVTCVDVSPDGRYGLSGSYDHTIRIWRLPQTP
jgi:WD40 repeat protein